MLIGHQRIWEFLTKSVRQNRLAHAYLFIGPSQVGKLTLAREWAKWQLCEKIHPSQYPPLDKGREGVGFPCGQCRQCLAIERGQNPDLIILSPHLVEKDGVKKTLEISIKEARELQRQLILFPYSAVRKIAIIEEAAAMSDEAANALLKTLEEPSSRSLIILVSASWQAILPTIISRCQLIKFLPVPEKEIVAGLKKLSAKTTSLTEAVKLAAGRPGRAMKLLAEPELMAQQKKTIADFIKLRQSSLASRWEETKILAQDPAQAQDVLNQWLLWLRDRLLEQSGQAGLVISGAADEKSLNNYSTGNLLNVCREIQKTQVILQNPSFNARLALEVLMTKI
ncbi:DNA polymerase III subunit [Patescibacteria group bacterium]|nr:DNA polymerase III subunit [Patescibacteria group bacterium]